MVLDDLTKNIKDIRNSLHKLRRENRIHFLEMKGIDVKKLQSIESETNEKYHKLAKDLQKLRQEEVTIRANMLVKQREAKKSVNLDAIKKFPGIFQWCGCYDLKDATYTYHGTENEGIFKEPDDPDIHISGPYNDQAMQAQPQVEIMGYPGDSLSGSISRYFVFNFLPSEDRQYCIQPEIELNGWWFAWPFNSGGCLSTETSEGSIFLNVSLKVEVRQGSLCYTKNPSIEEHHITAPNDAEGGIFYTSSYRTNMVVNLEANKSTTIFVTCQLSITVSNRGLGIIDLGSTPKSGFWVPRVKVSPFKSCWTVVPRGPVYVEELLRHEFLEIPPEIIWDEELPPKDCLPGPCPGPGFRPVLKPFKG